MAFLAPIAPFLALGGSVVSALGQVQAARAAEATGSFNARVAEQDAIAAEAAAAQAESQDRRRSRRLIASQRAKFAKGGVDPTGSPLLVLADTAAQAEMDALALRAQGRTTAARDRNRGALARAEGKQAKKAGFIAAGATLLGGASDLGTALATGKPA